MSEIAESYDASGHIFILIGTESVGKINAVCGSDSDRTIAPDHVPSPSRRMARGANESLLVRLDSSQMTDIVFDDCAMTERRRASSTNKLPLAAAPFDRANNFTGCRTPFLRALLLLTRG